MKQHVAAIRENGKFLDDAARARDTLGLAPARGFADSMAASREETR